MINEIKEAMESQQFLVLGDDSRKFIRYLLDELEKAQKRVKELAK